MRYGLIDKVAAWLAVALGLAGALAGWYWLGAGGGWVAGCLAMALSVFALGLGLWAGHLLAADVDHARGQAERAWREAERVWQLEEAEGEDLSGDRTVGKPATTFVFQGRRDQAHPAGEREQLRSFIQWCYAREAAGLTWGERDRGSWTLPFYRRAMKVLSHIGLVDGRRQGTPGGLVPSDVTTALAMFDANYASSMSAAEAGSLVATQRTR